MAFCLEISLFGSHSGGHYYFSPAIQTLEYELKTDQDLPDILPSLSSFHSELYDLRS